MDLWKCTSFWLWTSLYIGRALPSIQKWPCENINCEQLCEDGEGCNHDIYTCILSIDKTLEPKDKGKTQRFRCFYGYLETMGKREDERSVQLNTRNQRERGVISKGRNPIEDTLTGVNNFKIQPGDFVTDKGNIMLYVYLGRGEWMHSYNCKFIGTSNPIFVGKDYKKVILLMGNKPTACNNTSVLDRAVRYKDKNLQKLANLNKCRQGPPAKKDFVQFLCLGKVFGKRRGLRKCREEWTQYGCVKY